APLGGTRELLLAVLLIGRLMDGAAGRHSLPTLLRRRRATAARAWLSALTLPVAARATLARAIDSSGSDDLRAMGEAWEHVVALVMPVLNGAARAELRRLGQLLTPTTP